MATNFEQLKKEFQTLTSREKASLVHLLIAELETIMDEDAEVLWNDEARRRYESYQRGEIEAVPGREAMQRARQNLK